MPTFLFYPAREGVIKMFSTRYSQAEMDQWHKAASNTLPPRAAAAPRQNGKPAAMAKGQSERTPARADTTRMSSTENDTAETWASECLFECYNA
jgi:hypothetical protein